MHAPPVDERTSPTGEPAAPLPRLAPLADLRPCCRCGRVDMRRMVALMTLWFGHLADVPLDHGYFYLCPTCHDCLIAPHLPPPRQQPDPAGRQLP